MGQLQTRMVEDLQLRGYAPATCREYIRCARSFVGYHMRSPTELGERDVRRFLLYLSQERKVGRATVKMHTAAMSSSTSARSVGRRSSPGSRTSRCRRSCPLF